MKQAALSKQTNSTAPATLFRLQLFCLATLSLSIVLLNASIGNAACDSHAATAMLKKISLIEKLPNHDVAKSKAETKEVEKQWGFDTLNPPVTDVQDYQWILRASFYNKDKKRKKGSYYGSETEIAIDKCHLVMPAHAVCLTDGRAITDNKVTVKSPKDCLDHKTFTVELERPIIQGNTKVSKGSDLKVVAVGEIEKVYPQGKLLNADDDIMVVKTKKNLSHFLKRSDVAEHPLEYYFGDRTTRIGYPYIRGFKDTLRIAKVDISSKIGNIGISDYDTPPLGASGSVLKLENNKYIGMTSFASHRTLPGDEVAPVGGFVELKSILEKVDKMGLSQCDDSEGI